MLSDLLLALRRVGGKTFCVAVKISTRRIYIVVACRLAGALVISACGVAKAEAQALPEWTVLIYMNAKNNLEPNALDNFHSMASVDNSDRVNFLVQMGRPKRHRYTSVDGNWSGVYRFSLKKGLSPLPEQAAMRLDSNSRVADMGSPDALRNFIDWGRQTHPARKYMVVIWNHGQGWRFQMSGNALVRGSTSRGETAAVSVAPSAVAPALGGYRAISLDEDTGSLLYNRDVEDAIQSKFKAGGLEVIGFDACLMSMIETAYAFTTTTKIMVGSEDLEPAEGWPYAQWMGKLVADPGMTGSALAGEIVSAYQAKYGDAYLTTLSAVNLAEMKSSSATLSRFITDLQAAGSNEVANLVKARATLTSYGASMQPPLRTSVDLISLLDRYEQLTTNQSLKAEAASARVAVAAEITANYASVRSADAKKRDPYGSEGLAIYFPESRKAFLMDDFHTGYLKGNKNKPIDFVRQESWANFIDSLFSVSRTTKPSRRPHSGAKH